MSGLPVLSVQAIASEVPTGLSQQESWRFPCDSDPSISQILTVIDSAHRMQLAQKAGCELSKLPAFHTFLPIRLTVNCSNRSQSHVFFELN